MDNIPSGAGARRNSNGDDRGGARATTGRSARGTSGGGSRHLNGRVGDGGHTGGDRDDRGAASGDLNRHNRSSAGRLDRSHGAAAGGGVGGNLNGSNGAAGRSGRRGRDSRGSGRSHSLNTLGGGGLTAGAVGDSRTARGDGDILGRVEGLSLTLRDGGSKAGEESNGGSSETHCG